MFQSWFSAVHSQDEETHAPLLVVASKAEPQFESRRCNTNEVFILPLMPKTQQKVMEGDLTAPFHN